MCRRLSAIYFIDDISFTDVPLLQLLEFGCSFSSWNCAVLTMQILFKQQRMFFRHLIFDLSFHLLGCILLIWQQLHRNHGSDSEILPVVHYSAKKFEENRKKKKPLLSCAASLFVLSTYLRFISPFNLVAPARYADRRPVAFGQKIFWRTVCLLLLISGIHPNPGPTSIASSASSTNSETVWAPFVSQFQLFNQPNYGRPSMSSTSSEESTFGFPKGSVHVPLILSANVNSLPSKLDELKAVVNICEPQIFCLQETKLDSRISSPTLEIPG